MIKCDCQINKDSFDFSKIPLTCNRTWSLISSGLTKAVFQLESPLGKEWAKKARPRNIEELADLISIIRPGPLESGHSELYIERKHGIQPIEYLHPALKPILEKTYGTLIYQEASIQIAKDIAGFSLEEADMLRKCITGDTLFISKHRGWISIDKLVKEGYESDLFLTMDSNGKQQWKKIKDIWSTGIHTTRTIETKSGFNIKATKYHQFLTTKGWKARLRLKNNDCLITTRHIHYDGFDKISEDLALILTGIIAEGYFNKTQRTDTIKVKWRMQSTFTNFDKFMMDIFCNAFKNYFNELPRMNNDNKVVRLRVKQIHEIHKYLSFGLARTKKFPDFMLGMTYETTRKFLSYILACEGGSCLENGSFEFSSASRTLIDQVKLLLLRFGIRSLVLPHDCKEYGIQWKLYINNIDDQKILINKLTILWPDWKKKDLLKTLNNKTKQLCYTSDIIPNCLVKNMIDQYPYICYNSKEKKSEGGSLYKRPITRKRFKRLALLTKDDKWISLSNGNQYYDNIKNKNYRIAEIETFDFQMTDNNIPYIIANGIVIHNSLGKKDVQLMSKIKKQFIIKAKQKKIVNEEQADEIFLWIEKGQRYLFCKAHAVGYAMTSYKTAYCKAHFPLEFFTSYLSFASYKQKPREEIYELVQDARYFNIQVTPPNIAYGNIDFMTKDGGILFGLSHIKGIGRSAIKAIVKKNIELKTWNDFLKNVPVLHRNVAAALIKSGACDSYGKSRNRMLKELFIVLGDRVLNEEGKWKNITGFSKKERGFFLSNYRETDELGNFIKSMIDEKVPQKSRVPVLEKRIELLKEEDKDSNTQKALAEKHYLGIPLSCSVVDDVEQKGTHTCLQAAKVLNRTDINICGVIEKIKITKTRNGKNPGQTMCFLTVADATYSIDSIVVFPNLFDDIKHFLKEDTIISIEGEKRDRSIICSQVTKIL